MIYTHLKGGLGNQMLQYAAARKVAIDVGTTVCLETDYYNQIRKDAPRRVPELDAFNIDAVFISDSDSRIIKRAKNPFLKVINIFHHPKIITVRENTINSREILNNPRDNLYLVGYWHSESYFSAIRDILYKDFSTLIILKNIK